MSTAVPAAVIAAAACVLPSLPALPVLLLVGGAGIALCRLPFHHPLRLQRIGRMLVVMAIGGFLGVSASVAVRSSEQTGPPLPAATIRTVTARTMDHARSAGSLWEHEILATHVTSDQLSADARFGMRLIAQEPLPRGVQIHVDIDGIAAIGGGLLIARAVAVQTTRVADWRGLPSRLYNGLVNRIERVSGAASPLLAALLLGADEELSARTRDLFTRAGIRHVLALSGMHLAVLAALCVFVLKPFMGRRGAVVVAAALAVVYTALIGPRPSLMRATIMCQVGLLCYLTGRRLQLLEVLAVTFLVHVLVRPVDVAALGFQLSYLALAGIACVAPAVSRRGQALAPLFVVSPLSAGIGAQCTGAPLLYRTLGRIHPVGVVSGAVVAPLVALFMGGGILALLFGRVPLVGRAAPVLLTAVMATIERVAWFFAGAPALDAPGLFPIVSAAGVAACLLGLRDVYRRVV